MPRSFLISSSPSPDQFFIVRDYGRNISAIIAIFLCTAFAWMILALSIDSRTKSSGSVLGPRVESTWGCPQEQRPPSRKTRRESAGPANGRASAAAEELGGLAA